jgi:hypothetical protein
MSTLYSRRAQRLVGTQAFQQNTRELEAQDALDPARGLIVGSVIGTAMWAGLIALFLLLSGCGSAFDEPPPNQNTRTCYACTYQNGAVVQRTYACTPADAQQFGRACLR